MARKDDIFISFMNHEVISEKYKIDKNDLPINLNEGLKSKSAIIKAIALIVENSESNSPTSDKSLYTQITQFLNTDAI